MSRRRGPEGLLPLEQEIAPGTFDTRYHKALRRQSANRARRAMGRESLPELKPGRCTPCKGWGVVGAGRVTCAACRGSGG